MPPLISMSMVLGTGEWVCINSPSTSTQNPVALLLTVEPMAVWLGMMSTLDISFATANVTGVADHTVENLPICTVVQTTFGPVVAFVHQYAHYGKGTTVHSVSQLASFGLQVDEHYR